MKHVLIPMSLALLLGAAAAGASDGSCNVPRDEWQPQATLQTKLEAEGWTIKRIKVDGGCYEVYGVKPGGERVEAYFEPKTFALVKSKSED